MARFKVIGVAQKTSTGTQAYTGVGFEPSGLIAFGNNLTADGIQAEAAISLGGGRVGVAGRADFMRIADNVAASNTAWRQQTADALWDIDSITPTTLAEAEANAMGSDGFTLQFDVADATARIINFLAIGDVDFEVGSGNNPAAPGDVTVNCGFPPTCILIFYAGFTTGGGSANGHASMSVGFACFEGVVSKNACSYMRARDNLNPTDSARMWADDACILNASTLGEGGGAAQVKATLKEITANGFVLNFTASIGTHIFHWIAFNGVQAAIRRITQKSTTGSQVVNGVGFTPACVISLGCSDDASGVVAAGSGLSLGMASGPSDRAHCWMGDANAVSPSQADSDLDRTKVIKLIEPGSLTVAGSADLTSFDADGLTLNWDITDGNDRNILLLMLSANTAAPAVDAPTLSSKELVLTRKLKFTPVPTSANVQDQINDAGDAVDIVLVQE